MPRQKPHDGMFWVTAVDTHANTVATIAGQEGSRVYIRASNDVVIVERNDGTLIVTRVGKVLCSERAVIVRNRLNKALGKRHV